MTLLNGVIEFQRSVFPEMENHFKKLAKGQSPQTLFITCSDSRIDPHLFTLSQPGELFVIRNAGNIIPLSSGEGEGVHASIDYGVSVLNVSEIVVCGHSQCGAMAGMLSFDQLEGLPLIQDWLRHGMEALETLDGDPGAPDAAWQLTLANVRIQLKRLAQLPKVAERVAAGTLTLSGWCYRFEEGDVLVLDPQTDEFHSIAHPTPDG